MLNLVWFLMTDSGEVVVFAREILFSEVIFQICAHNCISRSRRSWILCNASSSLFTFVHTGGSQRTWHIFSIKIKCYIFQKKMYLWLKHRALEGALSRKRMIPPWRKDTKWWRHWRTTTFVSHSPDIVGSSDNTGAWDLFLGHLNLIKSKLCHCKWKAIKK